MAFTFAELKNNTFTFETKEDVLLAKQIIENKYESIEEEIEK